MPMVVGFTFTIAIIGYHVVSLIHMVYWIQLSVIKFVSDVQHVWFSLGSLAAIVIKGQYSYFKWSKKTTYLIMKKQVSTVCRYIYIYSQEQQLCLLIVTSPNTVFNYFF
jgi:hypothetical protein